MLETLHLENNKQKKPKLLNEKLKWLCWLYRNWKRSSGWTGENWLPLNFQCWWPWSSHFIFQSTKSCPTTDAWSRAPSTGPRRAKDCFLWVQRPHCYQRGGLEPGLPRCVSWQLYFFTEQPYLELPREMSLRLTRKSMCWWWGLPGSPGGTQLCPFLPGTCEVWSCSGLFLQTGSDWEHTVLEQREPNVQGWEKLLKVLSPCVKSVPIYFYICHRKCTFPGHKGVGVQVS